MKLSSVCIGMDVLVNGKHKRRVVGLRPEEDTVLLEDWPEPAHISRIDWADGRKPGCKLFAVGLASPSALACSLSTAIAEALRGTRQNYLWAGGDEATLVLHPWQWRPDGLIEVRGEGTWKGEP